MLWSHAVAKPQKYRVGVENIPYLPYYETVDSQFTGFAKELLDAFAKSEDITFEYVPLAVKRLYHEFLDPKRNIDFKFPDNQYWAQDLKKGKKMSYSSGLAGYTDGAMVLSEKKRELASVKKLGIVRGFTPWDYLKQIESKQVEVVENNSLESLLKLGMLGRVDAIYVNVDVANYLLSHSLKKNGALKFEPSLPHTKSSYTISTYKHPDIIARFNNWLLSHEAEHQKLLTKWNLNK